MPAHDNASASSPAAAAVELATELLNSALLAQRPAEHRRMQRMHGLVTDPAAKWFSMTLTDRLFRTGCPARSAEAFRHALQQFPPQEGFSSFDRLLLRLAAWASHVFPEAVVAAVRARLRQESAGVVLPAESGRLARHLAVRADQGMRMNLNQLGEAILGEDEALRRLETLEQLLQRPDVNYVSVKISAIASQISILAWDRTLDTIKERLRRLYSLALSLGKFVNLDMEEYRDLPLTLAAFRETLDEPEFQQHSAGIVLQAYLPDSWSALQDLAAWANDRVQSGGAIPKVRLVKGANLAMERVEAELHGWHPAPYETKAETDANFKRMLEFACRPENARVLHIGVASHNLLDVALALVLREQNGVTDCVEIEMLEGMADHQARAVAERAGSLLFYAPIVRSRDFGNALAYLVRRLDENTAPENFLRDLFSLTPESVDWQRQVERFSAAWEQRHTVRATSRRAELPESTADGFQNEADTDWTQTRHRESLHRTLAEWEPPTPPPAEPLEAVLARAKAAQPAWEARGPAERARLLRECAEVLSARRFALIAGLRACGRKAVLEADAEVSEAIDFARYYAATGTPPDSVSAKGLGTVVVAPPWNFPLAIPAGGVLAALMAGNSVILKPAPNPAPEAATNLADPIKIAWQLVTALWDAGIPRDVLQFLPIQDGELGRALITDSRVNAVILTGGYDTARMFLEWRPDLRLFAETSGKNALIITALADRDLAIKDLVRSAFAHSGQKCSAASLAILEAEVYDDPDFRRQLRDAAASLPVGEPEDLASVVTPLFLPPGESLCRAFAQLDPGESWLLEPQQRSAQLWSPGIKLGVQPNSWFHHTECFGPVLGLMRARDLDHAIELQNAVSYGLTAGLHTLDESEIAHWREHVQAGNLYINRAITGAIVQRQPFGGWKKSSIGPGAKAGGPNYVGAFASYEDATPRSDSEVLQSYRAAWENHFSRAHDPIGLRAESNVFRYRPSRGVVLRLAAHDQRVERLAMYAAETCGVLLEISVAALEPDDAFVARLPNLADRAEFLRTIGPIPPSVLRAAYAAGFNWIPAPLSSEGCIELRRWLREQSIAQTRHRYGNILPGAENHTPY